MPNDLKTLSPISEQIWDMKYRLKALDGTPADQTVHDTFTRVARAVAAAEPEAVRDHWQRRFYDAMAGFAFLPAGRILAGAGTSRRVTLFNCFVMGTIEDDLSSIFENVRQAALTMQQGGGIGHDFSTLRPRGAPVASIGADASGPVSFMDVWDAMCRTIMSAGQRRGAMMATLACDHPDIEAFIEAKSDPARLRNFNLSVLVQDRFIEAVRNDQGWDLVFAGRVYRTLRARDLWHKIMRATYDYAEPGVIFIDRINAQNNLAYCETISATNPCGEQPLPPFGACLLGSINLAALIDQPFEAAASLDEARLEALSAVAVRFLDNVIDVSNYPLEPQRAEALAKRRIGLGVTGLADALIMCGVRYGTPEAAALAGRWMAMISAAAYTASAALASEKGAFALYRADEIARRPFIERLPGAVRAAIAAHGLRNGLITSIAPTGTISLFAGNVSSGIEPVFDFQFSRRILGRDGETVEVAIEDYAYRRFRAKFGPDAILPAGPSSAFVGVADLTPAEHLRMQAALQRHVDSSISKTINCPAGIRFEDFADIYLQAYDQGLKGCTTYRPNAVTGAVLTADAAPGPAAPQDGPARAVAAPPQHAETVRSPPRPSSKLDGIAPGEVVYISHPLERDRALAGVTYKLKWPDSEHAIYITINDLERDGRLRPFEIFINSKNLEHYAWTVALTRMISAVFRRGGDVSFVVDELKAVFDPRGGQWMEGHYVPSLLAAIGGIIERHLVDTGFLRNAEAASEAAASGAKRRALPAAQARDGAAPMPAPAGSETGSQSVGHGRSASACPRCGRRAFSQQEGCWTCDACGYSRCT